MENKLRNTKDFVQKYLQSDTGKAQLAKKPFRDHRTGSVVWKDSLIAEAFHKALQPDKAVFDRTAYGDRLNQTDVKIMRQPTPRSTYINAEGFKTPMPDFTRKAKR